MTSDPILTRFSYLRRAASPVGHRRRRPHPPPTGGSRTALPFETTHAGDSRIAPTETGWSQPPSWHPNRRAGFHTCRWWNENCSDKPLSPLPRWEGGRRDAHSHRRLPNRPYRGRAVAIPRPGS
jgi:hypothetical protein